MPRDWPPVSVWLLCGVLVVPPAGVLLAFASGLLVAKFGIDYVLAAGLTACGLAAAGLFLRGGRAGFVAVVILLPVYAFFGLGGIVEVRRLGLQPRLVAITGPGVGMALVPPALLWWPETRRWCDLPPPRDPDSDE